MKPRPLVTYALLALNLAAFVLITGLGVSPWSPTSQSLIDHGADYGPSTFGLHQWYRLLSSVFLHVGVLHLLVNQWTLWKLGPMVESLFGHAAFAAVYLFSGLCGSLVSVAAHPAQVSAGASGALFGMGGALGALMLLERVPTAELQSQRNTVVSFVVLNLALGAALPFVDNAAHLGGLAGGTVLGAMLAPAGARAPSSPPRSSWSRWALAAACLPLLALIGVVAARRVEREPNVLGWLVAIRTKDLPPAEALPRYDEALAQAPGDPMLLYGRAALRMALNRPEDALHDFSALLSEHPRSTLSRIFSCGLKYQLGKDGASQDCERAEALVAGTEVGEWPHPPSDEQIGYLRSVQASLLLKEGKYGDAMRTCDQMLEKRRDDMMALVLRAIALIGLRRLDDALADADQAVTAAPTHSYPWNTRAWIQMLRRQLDPALADAERAVSSDPKSSSALGTRCFILVEKGDLTRARADCGKAVELAPRNEDRSASGMLAFLDRDYQRAIDEWSAEKNAANRQDLEPYIARARAALAKAPAR